MSPTEPLDIHLNGRRIAELTSDAALQRSLAWDLSHGTRRGSPTLSASLRYALPTETSNVANFLGGYLPEGRRLDDLAAALGLGTHDWVGMLARLDGDLAGAIEVISEHPQPQPQPVADDELPALLERSAGVGSVLAGMHPKVGLIRRGGRWWSASGVHPSTHILKVAPASEPTLAVAEAWSLGLGRALGLTTFDSHVEEFGDRSVLVVERFDRTIGDDGSVGRIHQEDTAQALGLSWRGDAKFERNGRGPTLANIAGLLDRDRAVTATDEPDKVRLLRYVTFNLAVGNTDAHAKNFAILRPESGRARLAPLYDVVPIAILGGRQDLALSINGEVREDAVATGDLIAETLKWGVPEGVARRTVTEVLAQLETALETAPIADPTAELLHATVRRRVVDLLRSP